MLLTQAFYQQRQQMLIFLQLPGLCKEQHPSSSQEDSAAPMASCWKALLVQQGAIFPASHSLTPLRPTGPSSILLSQSMLETSVLRTVSFMSHAHALVLLVSAPILSHLNCKTQVLPSVLSTRGCNMSRGKEACVEEASFKNTCFWLWVRS